MSYCRWSSDNWRCELYCYEDISGGYTTHVAGRKRIGLETLPPNPLVELIENAEGEIKDGWNDRYRTHHDALMALPLEDITLPHAGETFNDPDLASFKERLLWLRSLGYSFPDYVLATIDEEMKEEAKTTEK